MACRHAVDVLARTIFIVLVAWCPTSGESQMGRAPLTTGPALVVLTVDKPTFFLGENLLVHYCIENTGVAPFQIDIGGDYRGGSRSSRFKVTVTDARGAPAADPDPSGFNMGGLSVSPTIAPGARSCQSLPLVRYARIDAPGVYDVRVVHDLGWSAGSAPEGRIQVTLVRPTTAEAEAVIAAMETLPTREGTVLGRLSKPYPDFTALRYAVYLNPLMKRAQAGSASAVAGLGAIPTPDATRALMSLLSHSDRRLALDACKQLAMRLPDPALAGRLESRGPFTNQLEEPRRYLVAEGWRDELTPDVRAAARTWLASNDPQDVVQGAFMLEAVGTAADGRDLSLALTRAIERTLTLPFEKGVYPRPRGALSELQRAAKVLVGRGYTAPWGDSPGDIALWLVALEGAAQPEGWQQRLERALAHPIPYVRELGFNHSPTPVAEALVPAIRRGLSSTNVDEQIAACRLVHRAGRRDLGDALIATLRTAEDKGLLREVSNTLYTIGLRAERMNVLAARLDDLGVAAKVLDLLLGLFERSGGYSPSLTSADVTHLRETWQAFIAAHLADIEAGRRLSLDNDTPIGLIPPTWSISRPGKPPWPPGR